MNKILIVTPFSPYPAMHGGKVDIWNNIKVLKELGFKIDLIITEKNVNLTDGSKKEISKYVSKVILVERKNMLKDIFSLHPLQIESRKSLKNIILKDKYDFTLLEGDYVAYILENNTLTTKQLLLRSQNNEIKYFYNLFKSTNKIINKLYYFTEFIKFKLFVPQLYANIRNILFISCDEKKYFCENFKNLNAVFLPANVNLDLKKQALDTNSVLFIGSLFMENNKEGILWYLENVHAIISKNIRSYKLIIAGNSDGTDLRWLLDFKNIFNNIEIFDSPETLDKLYKASSVFINPMRHGAGVKLKTVEAIVNGLPVVNTSIGNEGTGLTNDKEIIVRDDKIAFAEATVNLLRDNELKRNLVNSAQKYIKENYNTKEILKRYLENLK